MTAAFAADSASQAQARQQNQAWPYDSRDFVLQANNINS